MLSFVIHKKHIMTAFFKIKSKYVPYTLKFRFEAGTSRGILKTKKTYIIRLTSITSPEIDGFGEAGPLVGLSVDDREDFEEQLERILPQIEGFSIPFQQEEILNLVEKAVPAHLPSIRFGVETALLDLLNKGNKRILANDFYDMESPIPINGLVWMGDKDFMFKQIREKIEQGFDCIKLKIGAIDFEQECSLLAYVRKQFGKGKISLRVDANGAFSPAEALGKLNQLAGFHIHSIEQPIQQGNWEEMADLCRNSPIPIALDEELIGIGDPTIKQQLLDQIRPQYIILKPTLVGGMAACKEWVRLAETRNVGWWITSALESNVGLNAIAQLTSSFDPTIPQGLGTGQLYHNNFESPLTIDRGKLYYKKEKEWVGLKELF